MTIEQTVYQIIREMLSPHAPLRRETRFSDIGDDLSRTEVLIALEDELDIELPDDLFGEDSVMYVGEVISYIEGVALFRKSA